MTPEVSVSFESIKIHFGGTLHLHLQRPVFAVQSWVQERQGKYVIQYTTAGGDVTSEYDAREKWGAILAAPTKSCESSERAKITEMIFGSRCSLVYTGVHRVNYLSRREPERTRVFAFHVNPLPQPHLTFSANLI